MDLKKLKNQLADLKSAADRIQATADDEGRDVTADEQQQLDDIFAAFDATQADISRRERLARMETTLQASAGRQTDPADPDDNSLRVRPGARISGGMPAGATRGSWGFRSFGEFARAVYAANPRMGGGLDPRLIQNAPTTVGTEGTAADGGHAVPPDFRENITIAVTGENSLYSRCDTYNARSNKIEFPIDETTPWQTTGGILTEWLAEAAQRTQTKPALEKRTLELFKLGSLVPITEELLDDAPLMDSYLNTKAPQKMAHAVNLAIVQGSGTGQPEGLVNSGSVIAVAKETGQAADSIVFENVVKMYARLYSGYRDSAVWLANPDCLPQLLQLAFRDGAASGGVPVFLPGGNFPGVVGAPDGMLLGRPLIFTEACNKVGDAGDLILAGMKGYQAATKVGVSGAQDVEAAMSMHLWFDYDVTAFRFTVRIGGQSWIDSAIAARDAGSPSLSNVVTLAARA